MTLRSLIVAAAVATLSTTPALPQEDEDQGEAIGTEQSLDPDDSPLIIRERPRDESTEEAEIRSEEEDFVQIPGAWATDDAACANAEGSDTGLYLTDTIIRWESRTCSIRNIDSENGAATIYSQCVGENGRSEQRFSLEVVDENTLSLRPTPSNGQDELALELCPSGQ